MRPRISIAKGWDRAPRALKVIKTVGITPPTISPSLVKKLTELLDELAIIRKDDPRIIPKLTDPRRKPMFFRHGMNAF